ncbi:hypothetical protein IWW36_001323 [Coemansia brasiliensis]|uniref:Uncharacterized protein n=1 Tax=Coemansia brasiliensis TaxID=2650707 RepID=A0A9W8I967_9FUNG|nr:hypothetical protein IWW36_001323 [Coemansia brasiliensis]
MISDGAIAGIVVGIALGCLLVICTIVLIGFKCKRSVEEIRQNAVQAAIDEAEEEDGFVIIAMCEKSSIDTGSLASSSLDMSTLSQTRDAQIEKTEKASA